jgi:MFS transporter, DHA1 family, multidrug resistance protein
LHSIRNGVYIVARSISSSTGLLTNVLLSTDPYLPVNWPLQKKMTTTLLYALTTMTASYASATISAGTNQISQEFHIGSQTATLATSLFLVGFGIGPLLWGPLSEVYGRKMAVLPPVFVAACMTFGTAVAKDVQTIMITRFFAGFFSSAPVTNTGGVLADLFPPSQRGIAIASYSIAVVTGPAIGPLIGAAYVSDLSLGWRWTEYFSAILTLAILLLDVIFCDETYPPVLLVYKARKLRIASGNWALHAKFEEWDISLTELAHKYLVRPIQIITTPIGFSICLYASFCYGILYMNLGAIPIIFGEKRHWTPVTASLPFLGMLVGACIAGCINTINQMYYNRRVAPGTINPELRLLPMMGGSVAFAGGLFIVGWCGPPENAPAVAPILGIGLVGVGFSTIFQSAINYLVDTFTKYGASAVAANTFLRSCFAAGFPLAVTPLYHNVGVPWGTSIFGFFAMGLIAVPFLLYHFGESLRGRSKWSRDSVMKSCRKTGKSGAGTGGGDGERIEKKMEA